MPFKSEAQRRFMYAKHPNVAKRWEKHTPKDKKLPEKVKSEFTQVTDIDLITDCITTATFPDIIGVTQHKKRKKKNLKEDYNENYDISIDEIQASTSGVADGQRGYKISKVTEMSSDNPESKDEWSVELTGIDEPEIEEIENIARECQAKEITPSRDSIKIIFNNNEMLEEFTKNLETREEINVEDEIDPIDGAQSCPICGQIAMPGCAEINLDDLKKI